MADYKLTWPILYLSAFSTR